MTQDRTKTELMAELDKLGLNYQKKWNKTQLQEVLDGGVVSSTPEPEAGEETSTDPAPEEAKLAEVDDPDKELVISPEPETLAEDKLDVELPVEAPAEPTVAPINPIMKEIIKSSEIAKTRVDIFNNRRRWPHKAFHREVAKVVEVYKIINGSRQFVRAYSEKVHGSKYKELALQFTNKQNMRVR